MVFSRFIPKATRHAFRWDNRAGLLTGLYAGMTVPFFGVIARRDLHASAFEISLLISAPFLGHLLSMVVAWHMQSRPKMPYMLWLSTLARGLMLFLAFAYSSPLFIGLVIAAQIAGCFTAPAYASIMKDVYPDTFRGRLMGLVRVSSTGATMLAGLLAGRLMEHGLPSGWVLGLAGIAAVYLAVEIQSSRWRVLGAGLALLVGWFAIPYLAHPVSYRVLFPIGAGCGLLALWMFGHLREGPVVVDPNKRFSVLEGLTTLITDRRFALYSLGFFIFGFGNLLQAPLIPLFQVDELHITDQWVGILTMITAGVSALCYMLWGRLMDRYNPFYAVIFSFAIWGFSPFVYAHAHTMSTLIVASILIGIASPGIDLTWLNAVMLFTERDGIPRYTALHTFLVGIRGLLAPFVGTWLFGLFTIRQCFYVSAGIIWSGTLFMAAVVWFVLMPYERRKRFADGVARRGTLPVEVEEA